MDSVSFFGSRGRKGAPIDRTEPSWSLKNMNYTMDHEESNSQSTQIDINLDWFEDEVVDNNLTVYVHTRISFANPLFNEALMNDRHRQILKLMP